MPEPLVLIADQATQFELSWQTNFVNCCSVCSDVTVTVISDSPLQLSLAIL